MNVNKEMLMLVILMLIRMLLNLNTDYVDIDADICIRIMSLCSVMNNSGNPLIQINCCSFSFLQSNGNGPETTVNFLALRKKRSGRLPCRR